MSYIQRQAQEEIKERGKHVEWRYRTRTSLIGLTIYPADVEPKDTVAGTLPR